MHNTPLLQAMDHLGPLLAAPVFVLLMSLVKEPARLKLNAVLVAGASGVYLSGGLGPWELLYPALALPVVYRSLHSHRFIGVAWLMHSGWDLLHHLHGNAIWPFMPTSSWGCMLFDATIALWFLAGAPSILALLTPACSSPAPPQAARSSAPAGERR
jgi:hypothetical protein